MLDPQVVICTLDCIEFDLVCEVCNGFVVLPHLPVRQLISGIRYDDLYRGGKHSRSDARNVQHTTSRQQGLCALDSFLS